MLNRFCKDESFWRNRFIKNFGEINKDDTRSWRNTYLLLVKYLNLEDPIESAAKDGYIDIVEYFINRGGDSSTAIYPAALYGHFDLIKYIVDNYNYPDVYLEDALTAAAEGGHLEILVFLMNKGYTNGGLLHYAAKGGHIDVIKFLIDKGYNNWNDGLNGAIVGGHMDLVKYFIELGAKVSNISLWFAKNEGKDKNILEYIRSLLRNT
jgi:ankyrin repeat protein